MFFSSLVQLESSIEQLLNAPGCWAVFLIAVVIFDFYRLAGYLKWKPNRHPTLILSIIV